MADADPVQVIQHRRVGHHGDSALHRTEVGLRRLQLLAVDTCVLLGLISLHIDRDTTMIVNLEVAVGRLDTGAT